MREFHAVMYAHCTHDSREVKADEIEALMRG